jgi:hypothetical protein
LTEVRLGICEQRVWLSGFNNPAGIQHHNAVKVENGIELVRDRDDGVVAELLANDALHYIICLRVDTVGK